MSSTTTDKSNADAYWADTKRWYRQYPELAPIGEVPVELFTSESQYLLEKEHLWPNVWVLVGRVEELQKPGDYLVKEIPPVDVSIIVARGRDGQIRAFHNACSHRGSKICWQGSGSKGTTTSFRCPYHGFNFGLDGKLTFVPDEANFYGLDKRKMSLRQIASDTWNGFVFINLNPAPRETLEEFLGEIVLPIANYPFSTKLYCCEYTVEVRANWKVLIASFIEGYHGHTFHTGNKSRGPSRENPFSHTRLIKLFEKHRLLSLGRNANMVPTRTDGIAVSRINASGYSKHLKTVIPDSPPSSSRSSTESVGDIYNSFVIHNIFPNLQLNIVGGIWYYYQFWPLAVDRVLWQVRLHYPEPRNASERFFVEWHKVKDRDILMEDGHVSELQQPVLRSRVFDKWTLQDEEIAIQHFNAVVLKYTGRGGLSGSL